MRMAQGNAIVLDTEAGDYFAMPGAGTREMLEPWDPASPTPAFP